MKTTNKVELNADSCCAYKTYRDEIELTLRGSNTADKSKNQWAQIVDVMTGKTLHTGQLSHIRRVARKRYNVKVQL